MLSVACATWKLRNLLNRSTSIRVGKVISPPPISEAMNSLVCAGESLVVMSTSAVLSDGPDTSMIAPTR